MAKSLPGNYGVDAPGALAGLRAGAAATVALTAGAFLLGWWQAGLVLLVGVIYSFTSVALYTHTTRRGKFCVWREELDRLQLRGDESTLDLGPGRGMVLILTLLRLPHGHGTGIDLWRTEDQSGNAQSATQANAELNGVGERVELVTGDIRELPFPDDAFDLVTSSLTVHNLPDAAAREAAVREALRVLRPGGRLLLADFRHTPAYAEVLRRCGADGVDVRDLGWRFWYGAPWFGTRLVTARKRFIHDG